MRFLSVSTIFASLLVAISGTASLRAQGPILHYTFDSVFDTNKTADSVGSGNFATLGNQVNINTTTGSAFAGSAGVLEMTNVGSGKTPASNGAVTNNSFSWSSDARTITFWWKAKTPVSNTTAGAYVSFGDTSANGTRLDVKEQHTPTINGDLRVEVQGTGQNTSPTDFDNGSWQFVAVTVPDNATFADIAWYVNGSATDLNTSTSTLAIATGTGPLAFGDSIIVDPNAAVTIDDRTPNGYLDDFQLYDRVLSESEILFLYQSPGSTTDNLLVGPIEFVQDDQAGFDLWPGVISGTSTTAGFTTDPAATTGITTVTITGNESLNQVINRVGSVDGTPPGYSFQRLYEDSLIAATPTGFLTIDVSGLNAGQTYRFTLFSWDPGSIATDDKVWTVTGGTGVPASDSVNYSDPLVDNNTFAMVFDITADGTGAFQLTNTAGLEQSAINGFILEVLDTPSNTYATWAAANAGGQVPELDFNGNGVANGVEFFMGGTLAAPAVIPLPVNSGGNWTFTIPYDPTATVGSWKFQVSEDLVTWDDLDDGDTEVQVLTGPDQLELTLPASATGRKFVRLVVVTS